MYTITIKDKAFKVDARSSAEAVDAVADYLYTLQMHGYFKRTSDLVGECDLGESVTDYAEAHGLTCCGNHNIYIKITNIEEVAQND